MGIYKTGLRIWAQIQHFMPHPWQSNGNIKGGIAHLGHQFGTSCLNPAIKKVIQDGIAEHL
jgi:hypothetical protein